jgi:hypothetical protein
LTERLRPIPDAALQKIEESDVQTEAEQAVNPTRTCCDCMKTPKSEPNTVAESPPVDGRANTSMEEAVGSEKENTRERVETEAKLMIADKDPPSPAESLQYKDESECHRLASQVVKPTRAIGEKSATPRCAAKIVSWWDPEAARDEGAKDEVATEE